MDTPSFLSYLKDKKYTPHSSIIQALDKRDFPFMKNTFFNQNPAFLAADEFNRCVEMYKAKSLNSNLNDVKHLIALMICKEDGVRDKLEECAISFTRELYDIPDKITLNTSIEWTEEISGSDKQSKDVKKEKLSDEQIHNLRYEIEKRRILNAIVHGSAIHQWTSAFFAVEEQLNSIQSDLMGLYQQYAALVNYLNWQHPLSNPDIAALYMSNNSTYNSGQSGLIVQGWVDVDYKNKAINTTGLCFPVIMHELLKGTAEFLIGKGVPNHLSPEELSYVNLKANNLQHEYWHYYLGPCLWRAILNTADVYTYDLPKIISALAKMDYGDLSQFCLQITFDAENTGKKSMEDLKRKLDIK